MGIGDSAARVDGPDKARGRTRFAADIPIEGLWHGAVVRAPVAAGQLVTLSLDPAFDWSQVVVVRPEDIPGVNAVKVIETDMPCLADREIRYLGEPVALVAAPSQDLARSAALRIRVDVIASESVSQMDELLEQYRNTPELLHIFREVTLLDNDVEAGLSASRLVVCDEYITGPQEHVYLEPQSMIGFPADDAGIVRIAGSLQCPYYVRPSVAYMLGIPDELVVVEQTATGGAFGGKEDFPSVMACHVALMARACGRPVRLVLSREEDMAFSTKRHSAWVSIKAGVDDDGAFRALDVEIVLDGGAYVTLSPVVLSRAVLHACGAYRWENVRIRAVAARTNLPPSGAFRGFGAPQTLTAIEAHVDAISERLGMTPDAIRRRNLLREGSVMATGQVLDESVGVEACLDSVVRRSGYSDRRQRRGFAVEQGVQRGMGLSIFMHGGGFVGSGERDLASKAVLFVHPDGRVEILISNTEMGQGIMTVMPQIVSAELGIAVDQVFYSLPDTSRVPDSGPTVSSRSTMIVGRILTTAARRLTEDIIAALPAGAIRAADGGGFILPDGRRLSWRKAAMNLAGTTGHKVLEQYDPPPSNGWDDATHKGTAYPVFSWGAVAVEVMVDPKTGVVSPQELWLAYDVGRAVNPVLARGQLEGGSIQALGWGLTENLTVRGGRYVHDRMQTYIIPTFADVPAMHLEMIEVPYSRGPGGAKGLGELPMNGVAAAIMNAVRDATGVGLNRIPAVPEVVLKAIENAGVSK